MKQKINNYLKSFFIDSVVFGLVMAIGQYLDSSEINVWKLVLLSMSMGAFSSYSFVSAIRRARKNHEMPLRVEKNNEESKKLRIA